MTAKIRDRTGPVAVVVSFKSSKFHSEAAAQLCHRCCRELNGVMTMLEEESRGNRTTGTIRMQDLYYNMIIYDTETNKELVVLYYTTYNSVYYYIMIYHVHSFL